MIIAFTAGNLCLYGACHYYCQSQYAVCGNGTLLEGSLAFFIHREGLVSFSSPWSRTYDFDLPAPWEDSATSEGYCDEVRSNPPFDNEGAILAVVDLHIFDFLQGQFLVRWLSEDGRRQSDDFNCANEMLSANNNFKYC